MSGKILSFFEGVSFFLIFAPPNKGDAQVAKLVDALLSGSSAARCAGSNPVLGTKMAQNPLNFNGFVFLVGQFYPLFTPFYHIW
jgi:hypothetical protein